MFSFEPDRGSEEVAPSSVDLSPWPDAATLGFDFLPSVRPNEYELARSWTGWVYAESNRGGKLEMEGMRERQRRGEEERNLSKGTYQLWESEYCNMHVYKVQYVELLSYLYKKKTEWECTSLKREI